MLLNLLTGKRVINKDADPDPEIPILKEATSEYAKLQ